MHVLDASRAVGVVNALLNEQLKSDFDEKTRDDYERLRREHAAKTAQKKLLTLEQARANRTPVDWSTLCAATTGFYRVYASMERIRGAHAARVLFPAARRKPSPILTTANGICLTLSALGPNTRLRGAQTRDKI